jgi:small subunit ribosomal protein S16
MVKLRLTRTGKQHSPSYRIVAIPHTRSRDSKSIEQIGHYSPLSKELKIDGERAKYWLSVGAQPSATVQRLLIKEKLMEAPKFKQTVAKKPGKKATERAQDAAA